MSGIQLFQVLSLFTPQSIEQKCTQRKIHEVMKSFSNSAVPQKYSAVPKEVIHSIKSHVAAYQQFRIFPIEIPIWFAVNFSIAASESCLGDN